MDQLPQLIGTYITGTTLPLVAIAAATVAAIATFAILYLVFRPQKEKLLDKAYADYVATVLSEVKSDVSLSKRHFKKGTTIERFVFVHYVQDTPPEKCARELAYTLTKK